MADGISCAAQVAHAKATAGFLCCVLPHEHPGPHWDSVDHLAWRVVVSAAIPRLTQALLTPSADLPACRDEDPAHTATLTACYPDPPEYQHPDEDTP